MLATGGGSSIPGTSGCVIAGGKYSGRGGMGMAVRVSSSTRMETCEGVGEAIYWR